MNVTFCYDDFCNEGEQPVPPPAPIAIEIEESEDLSSGPGLGSIDIGEDQFNCEVLYTGTSACEMRKAWLCDYARWRWTILSDWLQQFQNFRYQNGFDDVQLDMPQCADTNDFMCSDMNKQKCRYNEFLQCNECYCTDHQYTNFNRVMDHWRRDYRSWANVFTEYRRVMQNSNMNHDNGTC
jgi:hypothetical protein